MKKHLLFLFALVVAMSACNEKSESFKVNVSLANGNEKTIYLQKMVNNAPVIIDSAVIANELAKLTAPIDDPQILYTLKVKGKRGSIPFFADNKDVSVVGDLNNPQDVVIMASETQAELDAYNDGLNAFSKQISELYAKMNDAFSNNDSIMMDSLNKVGTALMEEQDKFTDDYIKAHPESFVGIALAAVHELVGGPFGVSGGGVLIDLPQGRAVILAISVFPPGLVVVLCFLGHRGVGSVRLRNDESVLVLALEAKRTVVVIDALHVGLGVIGEFDRLAHADLLASPVIVAEIHRGAGFPGDEVEAGLPPFGRLPRPFRGDGEVEFIHRIHPVDEAPDHGCGALPVHGHRSAGAEDGSQGPEEEFLLDHDMGHLSELRVEQVADEEVPDRRMRDAQDDGFLFLHGTADALPAQQAEAASAESGPARSYGRFDLSHSQMFTSSSSSSLRRFSMMNRWRSPVLSPM